MFRNQFVKGLAGGPAGVVGGAVGVSIVAALLARWKGSSRMTCATARPTLVKAFRFVFLVSRGMRSLTGCLRMFRPGRGGG